MPMYRCPSDSDSDDELFSIEEEDEEEDYPHPLGFSRYGILEDSEDEENIDESHHAEKPFTRYDHSIHQEHHYDHNDYPSRSRRYYYKENRLTRAHDLIENARLLQNSLQANVRHRIMDDLTCDMDRIAAIVRCADVVEAIEKGESKSDTSVFYREQTDKLREQGNEHMRNLELLAEAASKRDAKIGREMNELKAKFEKERLEAAQALKLLIDRDRAAAKKALIKEEEERNAAIAKSDAEAKAAEEKRLKEKENEKLEVERRLVKEKLEREANERVLAEKTAKEAEEAKEIEYLCNAENFIKTLDSIREKIAPFEKSKVVSKRRLNIKKVVKGKLNTLSHDAQKVHEVVHDVLDAIRLAKDEDNQSQQMAASSPEAVQGFMYFLDLLASNVVVRASAETFNSASGEGFPLANAVALISSEVKELSLIISAHIYLVCPSAIPRPPTVSKGMSEIELMDSLGMKKLSDDGTYESFDRFLNRTEGLISISAAIMCSRGDHDVMGGRKGAINWLQRFLKSLPTSNTLPITTAPVLTAFLTAAGHMLAQEFADDFSKLVSDIKTKIIPRLDESAIGAPSAVRLKKIMSGGLDAFKTTQPNGSIPELYGSSSPTNNQPDSFSSASPFLANSSSTMSNPFGQSQQPSSYMGGSQTMFNSQKMGSAPSPFGQSQQPPSNIEGNYMTLKSQEKGITSNPFSQPIQQSSSLGTGRMAFNSQQLGSSIGSFGGNTFGANNPDYSVNSGFTQTNTTQAMNSFQTSSSPFGNQVGFGSSAPMQQNTFSGKNSSFGQQQNHGTPINNPFGQQPSTFQSAGSNPFGVSSTISQRSNSSFGNGSSHGHPNGNLSRKNSNFSAQIDKPTCKFFAQGNCRYGNSCKYSHATLSKNGGNNGNFGFGSGKGNKSSSGNDNGNSPFGSWR